MKKLARLLAAFATTLVVPCAIAAEPDAVGRRLAATCAACHGAEGVAAGGGLPPLAGQPKAALIAKMKEFKAGSRPATVMHQLARGYTDEQIEALAAFFAAQQR